jgi:hypothetical protein
MISAPLCGYLFIIARWGGGGGGAVSIVPEVARPGDFVLSLSIFPT